MGGEHASFGSNFLISLGVGLLNFAVFYWVVAPIWFVALIWAIITVLMNLVIITIRHNLKLITSTLMRIGVAIGVLLFLYYLNLTLKGKIRRNTPEYYFSGDIQNVVGNWIN